MKKKSQSALFSPPGRWTGNNFLFKGGLTNMGKNAEITPLRVG